jgi:hypothetical protein
MIVAPPEMPGPSVAGHACPTECARHDDPFYATTNRTTEIRQPDIPDNGINA